MTASAYFGIDSLTVGKLYCSSARCDSWNGSNGDGSSSGKWNDR